MDFKTQLRIAYDTDVERRKGKEDGRETWKVGVRKKFADTVLQAKGTKILELGAGVGIDSEFFQKECHFNVLAIDLSPGMVETIKAKGIPAQVLDLYDIDKLKQSFDGVYSLNVLLHTPRRDLPRVIKSIHDILNHGGIFFYGVYSRGVDHEELFVDKTKMGLPRLMSYLSDESLLELVKDYFDVISLQRIDIESKTNFYFQSLLLRKKNTT